MSTLMLLAIWAASGLANLQTPAVPTTARDWWIVSRSSTGLLVSADASSLHCLVGECSIWEQTTYADARRDKVKTQKDFVRYDCLQRRTATLVEKSYLTDGQEAASLTAPDLQWQGVSEHTVGDDSLSFACNFLAQAAMSPPTSPLKFDGRTYVRAEADKPQSPPSTLKAAEATLPQGTPFRVQIAAAPTWQAAQDLLSALQRNHAGLLIGRDTKIEKSVVDAGVAFRVTIGGARSFGDAVKFCATLRSAGLQCFVRENPP